MIPIFLGITDESAGETIVAAVAASGDDAGNETDDDAGNETGEDAGNETDEDAGNETGEDAGNETGEASGNETGGIVAADAPNAESAKLKNA